MSRPLRVYRLGAKAVQYEHGLAMQEMLAESCRLGGPDAIIQLQHAPVYTVGKRGRPSDFKVTSERLNELGATVFTIPRGGETTFHGPGQVVLYPIINLRRLGCGARKYVEALEDTMVESLKEFGVHARGRVPGCTGVWVQNRKIGAVGVRISQGVTTHGIALNVTTDLSYFEHIVPCGITDKRMTNLQIEVDTAGSSSRHVDCCGVGNMMLLHFASMFAFQQQLEPPEELPLEFKTA